jgi:hypothetical protein
MSTVCRTRFLVGDVDDPQANVIAAATSSETNKKKGKKGR